MKARGGGGGGGGGGGSGRCAVRCCVVVRSVLWCACVAAGARKRGAHGLQPATLPTLLPGSRG